MKNQVLLSLFLFSMIFFARAFKQDLQALQKLVVTEAALTNQKNCKVAVDDNEEDEEVSVANVKVDDRAVAYIKPVKAKDGWIKKWGMEQSIHLIDYVEKILLDPFYEDATSLYQTFSELPKTDEKYKDPFDYLNFITNSMTDEEIEKYKANFALINELYVKEIYDNSLNAVQINKGMLNLGWEVEGQINFAKNFVTKYDLNGDGALNPREFILGVIHKYSRRMSEQSQYKKLFPKSYKQLVTMFKYLDCDNDNYVSGSEMVEKIKLLKNGCANCLFIKSHGLAEISVTDFILKSQDTKNGALNQNEFITGFLFGFWNRQCLVKGIMNKSNDDRSLRNLRIPQ